MKASQPCEAFLLPDFPISRDIKSEFLIFAQKSSNSAQRPQILLRGRELIGNFSNLPSTPAPTVTYAVSDSRPRMLSGKRPGNFLMLPECKQAIPRVRLLKSLIPLTYTCQNPAWGPNRHRRR